MNQTFDKIKVDLAIAIESFSELDTNWGGYNEDCITIQSIMTAHKVLNSIPKEALNQTTVVPMRDGGIQFNIGDFKEIEISDNAVVEILYDSNYTIINKVSYTINN